MKKIFLHLSIATAVCCSFINYAQVTPPHTTHSHLYGTPTDDHASAILQTPDSGFLLGGWVQSGGGQVSDYHGGLYDIWLVKTDSIGNLLWSKTVGGSDAEDLHCMGYTKTEYIIGGTSYSTNGDFDTLYHGTSNVKGFLAWINPANGHIRKMRSYTGNVSGQVYDLKVLPNGNIVILGKVQVTGQPNIIRVSLLDSTGTTIWSKFYGSANSSVYENPISIALKKNGGFLVSAQTQGNTGDVHGHIGGNDVWLLNLDDTGHVDWAKIYGGTDDDAPYAAYETEDSNIICMGMSRSSDFDVPAGHGGYDMWSFKTDDTGKVLWSKMLGGSHDEFMSNGKVTCDNGAIMCGYTQGSTDGDITNAMGLWDLFLVRLDADGNVAWKQEYGSTGMDAQAMITITRENGYALIGHEGDSLNHDISGTQHGSGDIWFARLQPDGLSNYCPPAADTVVTAGVSDITEKAMPLIYPNPVFDELNIEDAGTGSAVVITDITGRQVYSAIATGDKLKINMKHLSAGTYIIRLTDTNGSRTSSKIIKE